MFNIKKQINRLYISSVFSQLSLSGAWVAILSARGFSLAQIGLAETIFHIVSLLFEIPSGVLADVFGRKKTLLISCVMRILGNLIMVFSNSFSLVCLSMAFQALNYNFASGSDDSLAYDSMKSVGKEEAFEKYASNQLIIYRICEGISTLLAGLSLFLGYKLAYSSSIIFAVIQFILLSGLVEIKLAGEDRASQSVIKKIEECFKQSFLFLYEARKALFLMFSNSLVGALDVLLLFFLQAKLPVAGIPNWALGLALFIMQLGGVMGAKVILLFKNIRYRLIFVMSALVILAGIMLEHSESYIIMALAGFFAAMADDALQVRTNSILQDMFPSEQRATLISVESFTFSVVMMFMSPLAGLFFTYW